MGEVARNLIYIKQSYNSFPKVSLKMCCWSLEIPLNILIWDVWEPCIMFAYMCCIRYDQLLAVQHQNKDRLLSDVNRDMDQQRRIETLETSQKEIIINFSQKQQEDLQTIDHLTKKVWSILWKVRAAKYYQGWARSVRIKIRMQICIMCSDINERVKAPWHHTHPILEISRNYWGQWE